MTDTRERFLRDITAKVPADRIAELHLFRPIRRGPTETGIAVIAADLLETEPDPERHTVFTARYCLTLKGAERGKWEFDVVADADAPLIEVDTVVRGVQRRSGDEDAPERLAGADLRAELDGPVFKGGGVRAEG